MTKTVTIQDVARAVGVAKSTASAALNDKYGVAPGTREAVLQAARELGFEVNPLAQRLAHGRSDNTIGLFCRDLDVGVGTRKINRIQQLLAEQGFDVPIHACGYHGADAAMQSELMSNLRRQKPRAIVGAVGGLHADVLAQLERYQSEGGLVVCYDHAAPLGCDQVVFDREDNVYRSARHLLELGHREIGLFIHGRNGIADNAPRVAGFRRALREYNAPCRDEWLFDGALYEEGGAQMAARFLALPQRPTAMCIVNDYAAVAFISQLLEAGVRVPQDVSVVGHDNVAGAPYAAVPITSVSHPVEEIAAQVVELLSSRLEGFEGGPRRVTVRGELVVRRSAAAPHSKGTLS